MWYEYGQSVGGMWWVGKALTMFRSSIIMTMRFPTGGPKKPFLRLSSLASIKYCVMLALVFAEKPTKLGGAYSVLSCDCEGKVSAACWACIGRVLDNVWTTGRCNQYVYWTMAWSTVTGHRSEQSQAR